MRQAVFVLLLAVAANGSAQQLSAKRSMKDLTFLTRDGCVNTPTMRANLDQALKALQWRTDYRVIDIGTLAATDARVGYPTPTLLYNGRDLFGTPVPTPPYPEPS